MSLFNIWMWIFYALFRLIILLFFLLFAFEWVIITQHIKQITNVFESSHDLVKILRFGSLVITSSESLKECCSELVKPWAFDEHKGVALWEWQFDKHFRRVFKLRTRERSPLLVVAGGYSRLCDLCYVTQQDMKMVSSFSFLTLPY